MVVTRDQFEARSKKHLWLDAITPCGPKQAAHLGMLLAGRWNGGDGERVHWSQREIQLFWHLSESTVKRQLGALIRSGWLEQTRTGGRSLDGKVWSSQYKFTIPEGAIEVGEVFGIASVAGGGERQFTPIASSGETSMVPGDEDLPPSPDEEVRDVWSEVASTPVAVPERPAESERAQGSAEEKARPSSIVDVWDLLEQDRSSRPAHEDAAKVVAESLTVPVALTDDTPQRVVSHELEPRADRASRGERSGRGRRGNWNGDGPEVVERVPCRPAWRRAS